MSAEKAEHLLIWEFRVHAESELDFQDVYGPQGAWAKLFARSTGYLGTELLQDAKAVNLSTRSDQSQLEAIRC